MTSIVIQNLLNSKVYERATVWSYELNLSALTLHFLAQAHGKVKRTDMSKLDYLN